MRNLMVWMAALVLLPAAANARKNGLAGASGQGDQTCNDCHSGGAAPTVQLTGPSMLEPGATGSYRLVISGGAAQVGGLGVSVDDPGATLRVRSEGTRVVGGTQLVHNAPMKFAGGALSVDFELTAPSRPATLTLYAAGNSCDGDGQKTGDRAATASLQVDVPAGVGGGPVDNPPANEPQTGCSSAPGSGRTAVGWPLVLCLLLIAALRSTGARGRRRSGVWDEGGSSAAQRRQRGA